ncbi:MAG TPA: hypothetical protein PKV27_12785, partial [Ilumatobacteraceae bacterium]|nr:hypothetical protein [Ilumatobacteraceae bacterium]
MKPSIFPISAAALAAMVSGAWLTADPLRVAAEPLPRLQMPAGCVPHTPFSGGEDYPGDYRCAGMAIKY